MAGAKYIFSVPELLAKAEATGLPVVVIGDETSSKDSDKKPILRYSDLLSGNPNNTPRCDSQCPLCACIASPHSTFYSDPNLHPSDRSAKTTIADFLLLTASSSFNLSEKFTSKAINCPQN